MLFFASTTFASSLYGPTGLVTIPKAESLGYKEMSISYDYLVRKSQDLDEWFFKTNLGTFRNWEFGITKKKVIDEGVLLNLKYFVYSSEERLPLTLAMGVENIASKDDTSLYMVASKRLEGGFGLHFGFEAIFEKEILPSVMGGIEYYFSEHLLLVVDTTSVNQNYTLNFGAKQFITDEISLRLFMLDALDINKQGLQYTLGVSFSKFM